MVKNGTVYYDLAICTGVWKNSGTTANVTISLMGQIGELSQVPLRSSGEETEVFQRGGVDGFLVITDQSLGQLTEISLEHDNYGENPSWFVESVTVRDRHTEEQWVFTINRWLAVEKDDGEIEVNVGNKSAMTFSSQFRSRLGRKLADNHLWVSVFGKACSSTFTRVQRASCCLSVFFSAMISNAMFYTVDGESDGTIQVGPFKFSWRQMVIGVQSGFIIAPVNILIVFLFKSSKPRSPKGDRHEESDHTQQLIDQVRDPGYMFPHFCVYFAWFLCFATTLSAAAFTLFYSMMWGKEVAEQWLSSILISNTQDIFVLQPAKVLVVAVVVSFLLTRTKGNGNADEECERGNVCEDDINFLNDDPKERLKRSKLNAIRKRTVMEVKLNATVREILIHLLFVLFMAIVCYGNKNSYRFMMTKTLLDPFATFDGVRRRQIVLFMLWFNFLG